MTNWLHSLSLDHTYNLELLALVSSIPALNVGLTTAIRGVPTISGRARTHHSCYERFDSTED